MKEEKFKVINFIRELVIYIDKYLDNFPKKDIEIKNRIRNISYDLLELAYKANITKENKIEYINDIIAKIKVLDFLLNLCYDKEIINMKRYTKFGEKLDDILKYSIGWQKSISKKDDGAQLQWLASSGVNMNGSNYCNFGPGAVNGGNADTGNDLFNSNGNSNAKWMAVRHIDSINCGYIVIDYIRDNIETNYCPFALCDKIKIDKYICQ